MPFFNFLDKAVNQAVPSRAKPAPQKPAPRSDGTKGPSSNPAVMAAVAAAKKRAAMNLARKKPQ